MLNFHSVNIAEVNASSSLPDAPILTILASEDQNTLSWTSPYFTDFFTLYWSPDEFTSIDDLGVHIIQIATGPGEDPSVIISHIHSIPAAYGLTVLYYRVSAQNENGFTLSNQVNNYNFRLAIYEEIYQKTIEDLILRFTPEIRRQYEDSELWRSFVQSLCSELAQGRFEIKEALKQLNLQKAIDVFMNMWNDVTGISKINVLNSASGLMEPETDVQYRQRLVDSIFWDKVSNLALKKTMLLKLGYNASVLDAGQDPTNFRNVPKNTAANLDYTAVHGAYFIPGETMLFLRSGPNSEATIVSDTGDEDTPGTLTYINYNFDPFGIPVSSVYSLFGSTSWSAAVPDTQPPAIDTLGPIVLNHDVIQQAFDLPFVAGEAITFTPSGATGVVVTDTGTLLTFSLTSGSPVPIQWDLIQNTVPLATPGYRRSILSENVAALTVLSTSVHSKLLSNIYSVNLGTQTLEDGLLNAIYDEITPLASLGNVLTKILQDVSIEFLDYDLTYGNIPYGAIFMGAVAYSGTISTETNWFVDEVRYIDNQWTMADGKLFYGNSGPDDIVILTRIL
jgi:hypothetical protein